MNYFETHDRRGVELLREFNFSLGESNRFLEIFDNGQYAPIDCTCIDSFNRTWVIEIKERNIDYNDGQFYTGNLQIHDIYLKENKYQALIAACNESDVVAYVNFFNNGVIIFNMETFLQKEPEIITRNNPNPGKGTVIEEQLRLLPVNKGIIYIKENGRYKQTSC